MDNETPGRNVDCGNCGSALRAAARFCARCGTQTSPAEQEPEIAAGPPANYSADRRRELRVAGWLYGLLLFTSLAFGMAYRVEPEGDFGGWMTLVYGIVILGFAGYYRTEVLALMRPSALDRNSARVLLIATVVLFATLGAAFHLLESLGVPFERITDEMHRHDYSLWQLLALYGLAPALLEEIAFRGIIFDRLRLVLGDREGWLVQAAFFSVLHLSPVIFVTHFAMGLLFGWLRMRTGSLLPGMILHAAWNAVSILLEK